MWRETRKSSLTISVADPGCLSRIPDPDVYPSRTPDLGSRIQKQKQKRQVKKISCNTYLGSHKFHKIVNYVSFEVLKKQIWDPGSGIGCLLSPGSGIGLFRIPGLRSRIPNSYFCELIDNFLRKKFHNSLKFGPIFFLEQFNNNVAKFVATKNV
jgi:hypothetical protein